MSTVALFETQTDPFARFRGLAPEPKKSMSESAAAKLRAVNEQQRADSLAEKKFAEQFVRIAKDTWTIMQVLKRLYPWTRWPWSFAEARPGTERQRFLKGNRPSSETMEMPSASSLTQGCKENRLLTAHGRAEEHLPVAKKTEYLVHAESSDDSA